MFGEIGLQDDLLIGFFAAVSAVLLIVWISNAIGMRRARTPSPLLAEEGQTAFLFDGTTLLDATPNARRIVDASSVRSPTRTDIGRLLEPRFPGLSKLLQSPEADQHVIASVSEPDTIAECQNCGETIRLVIRDGAGGNTAIHPLALAAIHDEQTALRQIDEFAPQLIWQTDANGTVRWANHTYLAAADQVRPPVEDLTSDWPPVSLFAEQVSSCPADTTVTQRGKLTFADSRDAHWYDVTSACVESGHIHFATNADRLVQAEHQGKQFVQTLTKTFANLPIGLAIFDASRKLMMFNPAISDLTRLSPAFLTSRPSFGAFLERLRDEGILPEPKTYTSWREQVTRIEAEAKSGTYNDLWTLPAGETYRATGRPHPDGAFAVLVEDITSEITLTRSFRTQIDTANAVIDEMDEAVAVFSPAGTLMLTNANYTSTWAANPGSTSGSNLSRELGHWRNIVAPTPFWQKLDSFSNGAGERRNLTTTIYRPNGQVIACRATPISGGAILIGFQTVLPGQAPATAPDLQVKEA